VGENFGGGLFSTSPENLVTDFDRAGQFQDWNIPAGARPALSLKEQGVL
jgi:hypothetical protein